MPVHLPTPEAPDEDFENSEPFVVNRQGVREPVTFGKIGDRIVNLMGSAYDKQGKRLRGVNRVLVEQEVISRFKSGMTTVEIDNLVVDVCRAYSGRHPDYSTLAARIEISNLQRQITSSFVEVYEKLSRDPETSRISEGFLQLVRRFAEEIESRFDFSRDYYNAGFSVATLMRSYLMRDPATGKIAELPQHMYMRVALAIQCLEPSRPGEPEGGVPIRDAGLLQFRLEEAFKVYDLLSTKRISHASPTIFNAGTYLMQLSSCFQTQPDDDLFSLYTILRDSAMMSKVAGGVSISLDKIRAAGQGIRSSGGQSGGNSSFIRVANASQQYANQAGKRPGAFAMYLSPHHADIFDFLEMGRFKGSRFERREDGRFLKYGLWVPDRFMRTLEEELSVKRRLLAGEPVPEPEAKTAGDWYLFSPDRAPGLEQVHDERSIHHPEGPGGTYSALYDRYVAEGRYNRKVKASQIIEAAVRTISMTGNPYFLFKDAANRQSNLSSLYWALPHQDRPEYPVVSSNICCEVTIPCRSVEGRPDQTLYSVCNLGAVNLDTFVLSDVTAPNRVRFDFAGVIDAAGVLVSNLDRIIDLNYAPAEGCDRSNKLFRAMGIGVMGLADVFLRFGYQFGSAEALRLDMAIHACIYYGAMHQSAVLAEALGSFPAFEHSAASRGLLQPDLAVEEGVLPPNWTDLVEVNTNGLITPDMWGDLRAKAAVGLRNGYVTALMPTATSSNAVGVNECFEPYTTHLYTRKTLAGEFTLLNPHLVKILEVLKLWDETISSQLEKSAGSVASWDGTDGTPNLPKQYRELFATAREMDQLVLVKHSAVRNGFISQSQSLNIYWQNISTQNILEVWFSGWKSGLTTGSYYNHSMPSLGTQKTGVSRERVEAAQAETETEETSDKGEPQAAPSETFTIAGGNCTLGGDCSACAL